MAPRRRDPRGAVVLRTLVLLLITDSLWRRTIVTVRLLSASNYDYDAHIVSTEAIASLLEPTPIANDVVPFVNAAISTPISNDVVPFVNAATSSNKREKPLSEQAIIPENVVAVVPMYSDNNGTSTKGMDRLAEDLFEGNICKRIIASVSDISARTENNMIDRGLLSSYHDDHPHVVLRVQFHCRTLFEKSGYGTGNFISAIYALRMAARAMGNVQAVEFLCSDATDEASHLVLPWLTGVFPSSTPDRSSDAPDQHQQPQPPLEQACQSYQQVPIGYALDDITWEMRRLAVAMVGIPYPGHPAEAWTQQHLGWSSSSSSSSPPAAGRGNNITSTTTVILPQHYQLPNPSNGASPLVPDVELDDAVLHFRCGDLIFSNLSRFGFMKFHSYSKHLDRNVTSIGVATQPFVAGRHVRRTDVDMRKKPERCRQVIDALVEHLHQTFPHARIQIRNDPDESIALTFARLVMAKQVVVGISTFGVFPALATFGRSYVREPDYTRAPNQWLLDPWFRNRTSGGAAAVELQAANDGGGNNNSMLTLIREPRLTGYDCRRLWGDDGSAVLDWLRSPS